MKDKSKIKKQRSCIVAGTFTKEKLEDSEMKKGMTRKGKVKKKEGGKKRIRSNCKPKKTKRTCKRNTHLEEDDSSCPTDIDENTFYDDSNIGGFFC
jgi:hypothetical protein